MAEDATRSLAEHLEHEWRRLGAVHCPNATEFDCSDLPTLVADLGQHGITEPSEVDRVLAAYFGSLCPSRRRWRRLSMKPLYMCLPKMVRAADRGDAVAKVLRSVSAKLSKETGVRVSLKSVSKLRARMKEDGLWNMKAVRLLAEDVISRMMVLGVDRADQDVFLTFLNPDIASGRPAASEAASRGPSDGA